MVLNSDSLIQSFAPFLTTLISLFFAISVFHQYSQTGGKRTPEAKAQVSTPAAPGFEILLGLLSAGLASRLRRK